jgi:hypothetical protein
MACKGRCEADVQNLIDMTAVSVAFTPKVPGQLRVNRLGYSVMGWFLLSMGGVFLLLGVWKHPVLDFLFLVGGLFAFFGVVCMLIAFRMPRFDAREMADLTQGEEAPKPSD